MHCHRRVSLNPHRTSQMESDRRCSAHKLWAAASFPFRPIHNCAQKRRQPRRSRSPRRYSFRVRRSRHRSMLQRTNATCHRQPRNRPELAPPDGHFARTMRWRNRNRSEGWYPKKSGSSNSVEFTAIERRRRATPANSSASSASTSTVRDVGGHATAPFTLDTQMNLANGG